MRPRIFSFFALTLMILGLAGCSSTPTTPDTKNLTAASDTRSFARLYPVDEDQWEFTSYMIGAYPASRAGWVDLQTMRPLWDTNKSESCMGGLVGDCETKGIPGYFYEESYDPAKHAVLTIFTLGIGVTSIPKDIEFNEDAYAEGLEQAMTASNLSEHLPELPKRFDAVQARAEALKTAHKERLAELRSNFERRAEFVVRSEGTGDHLPFAGNSPVLSAFALTKKTSLSVPLTNIEPLGFVLEEASSLDELAQQLNDREQGLKEAQAALANATLNVKVKFDYSNLSLVNKYVDNISYPDLNWSASSSAEPREVVVQYKSASQMKVQAKAERERERLAKQKERRRALKRKHQREQKALQEKLKIERLQSSIGDTFCTGGKFRYQSSPHRCLKGNRWTYCDVREVRAMLVSTLEGLSPDNERLRLRVKTFSNKDGELEDVRGNLLYEIRESNDVLNYQQGRVFWSDRDVFHHCPGI